MANDVGSFNLTPVANYSRTFFGTRLIGKDIVSHNFSDVIANKGDSFITRLRNEMEAVDFDHNVGEYDYTVDANGIPNPTNKKRQGNRPAGTPAGVKAPEVEVKLDKYFGVTYGFKPTELAYAGDPNWLKKTFMEPALNALNKRMMRDLLALYVEKDWYTNRNNNFEINRIKSDDFENGGKFGVSDITDLDAIFANREIPEGDRTILLDSRLYRDAIIGDIVLPVNTSGDDAALRKGMIGDLQGFKIYRIPFLSSDTGLRTALQEVTSVFRSVEEAEGSPATVPASRPYTAASGDTGTAQSGTAAVNRVIRGIALHKESGIFCGRKLALYGSRNAEVATMVDPETGFTLNFKSWFSDDDNEFKCQISALYGVGLFDDDEVTAAQRNPYVRIFNSLYDSV